MFSKNGHGPPDCVSCVNLPPDWWDRLIYWPISILQILILARLRTDKSRKECFSGNVLKMWSSFTFKRGDTGASSSFHTEQSFNPVGRENIFSFDGMNLEVNRNTVVEILGHVQRFSSKLTTEAASVSSTSPNTYVLNCWRSQWRLPSLTLSGRSLGPLTWLPQRR